MCESVLCLICALLNNMVMSSLRGALTDTRFEVPFLDGNSITYLCLNSVSTLPLSLPFFKLRLQSETVFAQVEVRRSSSTGLMGVRRKNVMRNVAS